MGRLRTGGIAAGVAVVVLGIAFGWSQTFGNPWRSVVSVERSAQYQDPALLQRALAMPVAARYVDSGLDYQRNPSFCGPTTAVDVVRSLGKPADQSTILSISTYRTYFGMLPGGLTLEQLAQLLRWTTDRKVTLHRNLDLAKFRALVALANDPGKRVTINLHRGPLFGHGGGHHSPIGAYLADEDLVLVLDVNASYKPWLAKTTRLFEAIDTVDSSTGLKRGLLVVE